MLFEELFFDLSDLVEEDVHFGVVETARAVGEVVTEAGELVFVNEHEGVDCAFSNAEAGEVGQEVISYEEAEEDEVVDEAFEIVHERELQLLILQMQIFPYH